VPLTIAIAIIALWPHVRRRDDATRLFRACASFTAGVLPGVTAIALLNTYLYGGPTVPSYTHIDSLFRWRYAGVNLTHYVPWLIETQTPFVAVALLPLAARRFTLTATAGERRPIRIGLATFVTLLTLSYLFYQPYEDWWFLRFFLPAFPVLLVLAIGAVRSAAPLIGRTKQMVLLAATVLLVFGWELSTAQSHGVYTIRNGEQRYVTVGRELTTITPDNAVFLSMQHSGSLRYYTRRLTVRYDILPIGTLEQALTLLKAQGFRPYFVLEEWEVPKFRARFAQASAAGRIDWPPAKTWSTPVKVLLYDPSGQP